MRLSETIDKIINAIYEEKNFFEHRNILLVGENISGKSKTIAKIVKELFDRKAPVYYICSWNRKIINKRTELKKTFRDISPEKIVETRLCDSYFNEDVFCDDLGIELTMNEIYTNTPKYTKLFMEYLELEISTSIKNQDINFIVGEDELLVNGHNFEQLSDAQVSMMRLLMEINYAYEQECRYIFIDEFDINLDHKNSGAFLEWLNDKYENIIFIVSAHSLYTILNLKDFDIVKIVKSYTYEEDNLCVFFDSNDLDNVDIIDKKLFYNNYNPNELDELISSSLKCILSNIPVNHEDIEIIEKSSGLTTRQKVVLDFIKQRMGNI